MTQNGNWYRIVLALHLHRTWVTALPVEAIAHTHDACHAPVTDLTLRVADQAELINLLLGLHGHGIQLISMDRLEEHERAA